MLTRLPPGPVAAARIRSPVTRVPAASNCADAMPDENDLPVLELDGDMARISFEGTYFPLDDVLAALTAHLRAEHLGKLDVLDLEGWRLIRHTFAQGRVDVHSAPLNNVLDYSGH